MSLTSRKSAGDPNLLVSDDFQGSEIDSYTKLLIHGWGADARTTIIDSSPNNYAIFASGNAQIDTTQSKFGGSSVLFDGTGDYLTIADSTHWDLDTGDFTIDFWVNFNVLPTAGNTMRIICQRVDDNNEWIFRGRNTTDTYSWEFDVWSASSNIMRITKNTTLNTGTWYHVEVTRSGTTYYIFQAGSLLGSTTDATAIPQFAGHVVIGETGAGAQALNGWLSEIRLTKGTPRHTAAFTAPTTAYGAPNTRWTQSLTDGGGASDIAFDQLRTSLISHSSGTSVYLKNALGTRYSFPFYASGSTIVESYLQLPSDGTNAREINLFLSPTNPSGTQIPTDELNYLRFRLRDNAGTYDRTLLKRVYGAAEATISGETVAHTASGYSPLVNLALDGTKVKVNLDGALWLTGTAHALDFRLPLDSVFTLSGSTFTDNTAEAASPSGTAFNLISYSGTNYLYMGRNDQFRGVFFKLLTNGSYGALTWQYPAYTGASATGTWTTLTVAGASGLSASPSGVSWTKPTDWTPVAINSTSRYWVRASAATVTTAAAAYQLLSDQVNQFYPVLYHATSRAASKVAVFDGFNVTKHSEAVT